MRKSAYTFLCLILACGKAIASDCGGEARNFISHPDERHYLRITGREECWNALYEKDSNDLSLTRLVKQGNIYAARFVATSLHWTDGASAEDAHIMLSESIDDHPALLLQLVKEKELNPRSFRTILSAEPERFVDDEAAFRKEIARRLQAIKNVDDPALTEEKALAIALLTGGPAPSKYASSLGW